MSRADVRYISVLEDALFRALGLAGIDLAHRNNELRLMRERYEDFKKEEAENAKPR